MKDIKKIDLDAEFCEYVSNQISQILYQNKYKIENKYNFEETMKFVNLIKPSLIDIPIEFGRELLVQELMIKDNINKIFLDAFYQQINDDEDELE